MKFFLILVVVIALAAPTFSMPADQAEGSAPSLGNDIKALPPINLQDFDGKTRLSCRVYGINAPELRTVEGKAALAFAQTLIAVGDRCIVSSYGWDKYGGRFDGTITRADGRDFGTEMLDAGQAVPYGG